MTQTKNPIVRNQLKDPNLLRNKLHLWSIYLNGARDMLLRLRDCGLLEESRPKNGIPRAKGDELVINKALVDLLLSAKTNCELFLMDEYQIRFTDHERDKKGKLVKCRAYFAKRVTMYQEVK